MRLRATPIYAWLDGRCAPPALAALTSALSYYRPGYRYTWLFQHGRWDGKDCLLYTLADAAGTSRLVFPAGLLPAVRPVLERYGAVEIDATDDPRLPERAMPETLPDGTTLYADQIIAGRSALKAQRGLLALATGFGKTELAAAFCTAHPDRRCLILENSRPLLTQTAERLENRLCERVGRVGAGLRFMRDRVVVGMVQTLAARLRTPDVRRLLAETGVLIADECFVSGTLVDTPHGPKPIEAIRVGDLVFNAAGTGTVLGVLRKTARRLVRIRLSTGEEIFSTPSHRFLTPVGWVEAEWLAGRILVRSGRFDGACKTSPGQIVPSLRHIILPPRRGVFLRSNMRGSLARATARRTGAACDVHATQTCGSAAISVCVCALSCAVFVPVRSTCLLQLPVHECGASRVPGRTVESPSCRPSVGCGEFRRVPLPDDCKQPHAPFGHKEKSFGSTSHAGASATRRWWQWTAAFPGRTGIVELVAAGAAQLCRSDAQCQHSQYPSTLQDRHRTTRSSVSGRGRWRFPQQPRSKNSGCKENANPDIVRVESVAVYEPPDSVRGGGSTVYDLKISGHPSYSVCGVIVHNCHRVTPVTWFPVLAACPAPLRIGMSGTVKEGNLLLQQAFFGPVLAEVRDLDLVESGRSAEPVILMPAVLAAVPDGPDYGRVYQEGVVENEERNRQIAQAAVWGVRRGYRVVILYYRLDHGRGLAQRLRSAGITAEVADGTMPPGAVEEAKRRILAREVQVLLASTIFNVGVDLPAVEMWINAAAWRSPVASSQKLGRALRRKPEGANRVVYVDPHDYGCSTLGKHADRRLAVYKRKGFAPRTGRLEELLEGVPA